MPKQLTIIGCGPGSSRYLTQEAIGAASSARVLLGSKRLLDLFNGRAEKIEIGANVSAAIEAVKTELEIGGVAVLVSGDTGLCSLATPLIERFGKENCRIVPGISSIQLAFSKVGIDWYGARIVTAHKENPNAGYDAFKDEKKIALLAGRPEAIEWASSLAQSLGKPDVYLCENLGLEDERVEKMDAISLNGANAKSLSVILIINEKKD